MPLALYVCLVRQQRWQRSRHAGDVRPPPLPALVGRRPQMEGHRDRDDRSRCGSRPAVTRSTPGPVSKSATPAVTVSPASTSRSAVATLSVGSTTCKYSSAMRLERCCARLLTFLSGIYGLLGSLPGSVQRRYDSLGFRGFFVDPDGEDTRFTVSPIPTHVRRCRTGRSQNHLAELLIRPPISLGRRIGSQSRDQRG